MTDARGSDDELDMAGDGRGNAALAMPCDSRRRDQGLEGQQIAERGSGSVLSRRPWLLLLTSCSGIRAYAVEMLDRGVCRLLEGVIKSTSLMVSDCKGTTRWTCETEPVWAAGGAMRSP